MRLIDLGEVRSEAVALQPLEHTHAAALLYQYRDPQIAELTLLPALHSEEEVVEWIEGQITNHHTATFAIVHQSCGFVGVTGLRLYKNNGFFYFWVGSDYQGQGIGPQAANLLIYLAQQRFGLQHLFTALFKHNERSRKILVKLGFLLLPFSASEPYKNVDFLLYGNHDNLLHKEIFFILNELLQVLDSPLALLPMLH